MKRKNQSVNKKQAIKLSNNKTILKVNIPDIVTQANYNVKRKRSKPKR